MIVSLVAERVLGEINIFCDERKHDRNRNRRERNFLAARMRLGNDDWRLSPLRWGQKEIPTFPLLQCFQEVPSRAMSKSKGNESQRRKSNYFSLCRILSFNRKT